VSYQTKFFTELLHYAKSKFPLLSKEQEDDLLHIATYREAGLCAARGFGKTLIACIYEDFMVQRNWSVCHCFKNLNQAAQWYTWMELLGYKTTLWEAHKGRFVVYLRIYQQGRGPRFDVLINDECGTVILPLERKHFSACQHMLSGSKLGKSVWVGTQDPNSIWEKGQHQRIRGYNAQQMPWVTKAYLAAVRRDPPWSVDQEFHCKATPAGGLLLPKCIIQEHPYKATRYGIDSNPEEGYYVVGSHKTLDALYVCDARVFYTLRELGLFIMTQHYPNIDFELEMNGPGGVVANYFDENEIPYIRNTVTDATKIQRCSQLACKPIVVPPQLEHVYRNLTKQIWNKDKKIEKFDDAHWFDATWHSDVEEIVWA
jgi:hypothetical protein